MQAGLRVDKLQVHERVDSKTHSNTIRWQNLERIPLDMEEHVGVSSFMIIVSLGIAVFSLSLEW